eukprot:4519428-Pyramimonas_sp.AAC.1
MHRYTEGSNIFTAPREGTYNQAQLQPANASEGPDRRPTHPPPDRRQHATPSQIWSSWSTASSPPARQRRGHGAATLSTATPYG